MRRVGWSLLVVVVLVGVVAACVPPGPSLPPPDDPALVALDIVPAGSYAPPDGGDVGVEARMYDSLALLGSDLTDADVAAGFKSASLEFPEGDRARKVERPKSGVLIRRDRFNVPYVTATTDRDARWAVGWLAASHAPLLYDVARRNARLAALRVPDVDVFGLTLSFNLLTPSATAERALDEQLDALAALGPEGAGGARRSPLVRRRVQRATGRHAVALAAVDAPRRRGARCVQVELVGWRLVRLRVPRRSAERGVGGQGLRGPDPAHTCPTIRTGSPGTGPTRCVKPPTSRSCPPTVPRPVTR